MNTPLDEAYLSWLYSQIASTKTKNPTRTYWSFARQLYTKEFVWLIPNDDNRMEDGRDLRYEFFETQGIETEDMGWLSLGCSMLELLIAISRRLSFEAEGEPIDWFWHLMNNLGLTEVNDKKYTEEIQFYIDDVLDRVIWRKYAPDGSGGLFPLKNPPQDQRRVEIWYQLSAYLVTQN